MSRVRCPGCDRVVKVADGDAKVRCPSCGQKIDVDERDDEEEDDEQQKTSSKKRSSKGGWGSPSGKTVDVETGRAIYRSFAKTFFTAGGGAMWLGLGCAGLLGGSFPSAPALDMDQTKEPRSEL